jgi:uroporphyrinogen decarboxylase
VADVALDEYKFSVAKTMTVSEERKMDLLDMKEYGRADKVIVDIITLDSEACAPCQYMVEAVKAVAPEFEGIVEWREHKIKKMDSIVFMTSLMVRNIPTICIDGEIKFVSRIPARDELVMAIQRRVNEKMRLKIQSRKASVFVLGHGPEADAACKNMNKAIAELGADISVRHIKDNSKIAEYGFVPSQTPVTIMARYQTKSIKSVPEVQIIKEWIKDII